ncbi:MAG: hypothetical protein INH41_00140 [Myxococcaceae bacterium]|jgi:hypothetical protein|nr:hypothetical protein [Myxococcaceae bacterium]MCA3010786.1 hypothetical protein [Myxococcaceae bacterium]
MKSKSVALTGALAALGLALAYLTWQRPKETASAGNLIKVVDASKSSFQSLKYEDGQRQLSLKRENGELWLTTGFMPGKEPAPVDAGLTVTELPLVDGGLDTDGGLVDAGVLQVTQTPPPKPPPTRVLKGNERAEAALQKFMPLEATRALGPLSPEKLAELGLTDSPRRLELVVGGTARVFTVAKTLPGIFGLYMQEERTKDVFLFPGSLLADFDPQSQVLVDRRLHAFKQAEFDAFVVKADGKEAAFVQSNAELPTTAKVARAASPDKPDELVKNWHDKVWGRLIVTEVLGKGELPLGAEPTVVLRVDYTFKGREKGWLELAVDASKGTWARSENTASWVAVHQGSDELLIEARKLVLE